MPRQPAEDTPLVQSGRRNTCSTTMWATLMIGSALAVIVAIACGWVGYSMGRSNALLSPINGLDPLSHGGSSWPQANVTRHEGYNSAEKPHGWCLPDEYVLHFEGAWRTPLVGFRPIPAIDGPVSGLLAYKATPKGFNGSFFVKTNSSNKGGFIQYFDKKAATSDLYLFWEGSCVHSQARVNTNATFRDNDLRFCQKTMMGAVDLKKSPSTFPGLETYRQAFGPKYAEKYPSLEGSGDASLPGTELMVQMMKFHHNVAIPVSHTLASGDGSYFVNHVISKVDEKVAPGQFELPASCPPFGIQEVGRNQMPSNTICPFFS
ncbi:hypothetical protein AAMO2058_000196100 [Amorphochlora amoebiformis]